MNVTMRGGPRDGEVRDLPAGANSMRFYSEVLGEAEKFDGGYRRVEASNEFQFDSTMLPFNPEKEKVMPQEEFAQRFPEMAKSAKDCGTWRQSFAIEQRVFFRYRHHLKWGASREPHYSRLLLSPHSLASPPAERPASVP